MPAYLLSAVRTPLGSFGGGLKSLTCVDLAARVVAEALARAGVPAERVGEVVMGCVLQAGAGLNVARQAALQAGLPSGTPAHTPNMACGTGLKAVALAAQALGQGDAGVVVAGGAESMSSAPYLLPAARWGARMGAARLLDAALHDGLWCSQGNTHLGLVAEAVAAHGGIPREAQDAFAAESHRRAAEAAAAGLWRREIVPVGREGKGGAAVIAADEGAAAGTSLEDLARLEPAFRPDGTVTAGNASGLADGAAALVLASEAGAAGLKPLARILGFHQAGADRAPMGLGAVPAIQGLLAKTGLACHQVDLWEVDEASAAQVLGVLQALPGIDPGRVNPRGGALALGRPLGAAGARILVTLLHALEDGNLRTGVAALSAGGGMGVAMAVERL